ncbi:MAG: pilus assembly protein TadG-related protein [Nitrososphaera sp.]
MRILRDKRGAVLIYVTLFLLLLGLLFIALGTDVGWMAYVRTQGQAATDAAALRAAAAIPNYNTSGSTTLAYNMASGLNSNNTVMNQAAGVAGADVQFCTGDPNGTPNCSAATFPTPALGVSVTKTYSTPLFFSRILNGGNNANITVSSIAWLGGPGGLCPDLPIALCAQNIGYNPSAGDFTCNESLDATLIPNTTDSAGWWAPLGQQANASWCSGVISGNISPPCTSFSQTINLNNGEINTCQDALQDKFAALGCFTPKQGNTPGIPGTQCAPGGDPELRKKCTVTLPVVVCGNAINQQQDIVGYASACIKYIQDNPDAYSQINLECSATAAGPGGGVFLGTYATRPALIK